MKYLLRALVRGTAFFFGCFSLINTIVSQLGSSRLEDIWWVDLSFLPAPIATILALCLSAALIFFALKPSMNATRKVLTGIITLIYAFISLLNALGYYQALDAGSISSRVHVPFSLIMFGIFVAIAIAVYSMHTYPSKVGEYIVFLLVVIIWFALFPLAQIELFGRTNYEIKSQIAVVFGARVYPNGMPSATVGLSSSVTSCGRKLRRSFLSLSIGQTPPSQDKRLLS